MRCLRILAVSVTLLCPVVTLAPSAGAATATPAVKVVGTYVVTFTPLGGSSFSYDWTLARHHVLRTSVTYSGTWRYRAATQAIHATYTTPAMCTFNGTGTPAAGFSGDYNCPTGSSGTWSTGPRS